VPPDISLGEARRIALAAQGFADSLPKTKGTKRHLHRVIGRTGVLQLDSVNIVARPQYVVPFSRIGKYAQDLLDEVAYHDRAWFEYWGHAASLIPVERYPLFRPRMEAQREHLHAPRSSGKWDQRIHEYVKRERPYMDAVLAEIRDRGALSAGQLTDAGKSRAGVMWGWSRGKQAIEMLFRTGEVAALRRPSFERVYDLPERVIPHDLLSAPIPDSDDAERELVRLAMQSLGVATVRDIADYYRAKVAPTKRHAEELADAGVLKRVTVEGWTEPAYLSNGSRVPKTVDRPALVTPFDPMVWNRDRAIRLFGFAYNIEIYVPAPKRVYGYYVFPFINGDHFAGRVDLKADRKASTLRVLGAWREPHATPDDAAALKAHLRDFADFLGLEEVHVSRRGNLASALQKP
jgi:uncharacterized protein